VLILPIPAADASARRPLAYLAPDFPGFDYSDTLDPARFGYDCDACAGVLERLADALGLDSCVLWLHDYGSQIGLRHAIAHPPRISAIIIQNGDILR
jgi:pimeloyl-ACP methyl ester carboxylesterase